MSGPPQLFEKGPAPAWGTEAYQVDFAKGEVYGIA